LAYSFLEATTINVSWSLAQPARLSFLENSGCGALESGGATRVAAHRSGAADRRHRSPADQFSRLGGSRRARAEPCAVAVRCRSDARGSRAAGLGFSDRTEIAAVLDGLAEPRRKLEEMSQRKDWIVETSNPI